MSKGYIVVPSPQLQKNQGSTHLWTFNQGIPQRLKHNTNLDSLALNGRRARWVFELFVWTPAQYGSYESMF